MTLFKKISLGVLAGVLTTSFAAVSYASSSNERDGFSPTRVPATFTHVERGSPVLEGEECRRVIHTLRARSYDVNDDDCEDIAAGVYDDIELNWIHN